MITLNLTEQQIQIVVAGLQELPYKFSAATLEALRKQLTPVEKPKVEEPKEDA